jgi:hypothetical protein
MSNKRTPPILLITGKTGSGKSEYVASFLHAYVIDPLQGPTPNRRHAWQPPAPNAKVDMVVFDHMSNLPDPRMQLAAASEWCMQHEKPLWIVLQSKNDFDTFELPFDYDLELRLSRESNCAYNFATLHDKEGMHLPPNFDLEHGQQFGMQSEQDTMRSIIVIEPAVVA